MKQVQAVIVGGGTMGADVAVVLARGGHAVTVVDPNADKRGRLAAHVAEGKASHAGLVERAGALVAEVPRREDAARLITQRLA